MYRSIFLYQRNDKAYARLLDGLLDADAILLAECQYLFGKDMFATLRDAHHDVRMGVGSGADDHTLGIAAEQILCRFKYGNSEFSM
jgi:hypothetical protein